MLKYAYMHTIKKCPKDSQLRFIQLASKTHDYSKIMLMRGD